MLMSMPAMFRDPLCVLLPEPPWLKILPSHGLVIPIHRFNYTLIYTIGAQKDIQPTIESLKTHHKPASKQQIQRIRSVQAACEFRHLVIDEEISAVDAEDSRRFLLFERDQVMKQAEMCAASLAPIRRTPSEILGEIFLWCLPQTCHPNAEEAPLLLCRVSRFWRYVAESTPQLWSEFSVIPDDLYRRGRYSRLPIYRQHIGMVAEQWISRAGFHSPLSLRLDGSLLVLNIQTIQYFVKNILIQNSARCRTLYLEPPSPSSFDTFFTLTSSHIPLLEHLILKVDQAQKPMPVFETPPRLRKLSITHASGYRHIHPLPWSQLTHLEISSPTEVTTWITIFSQCVMLQHGVFNLWQTHPPLHGDDVIFPHLHDLDIRFEGTLLALFESFHLPVLAKLCLRDFIGCKPFDMWHRLPQLQTLSFVGGVLPDIVDLLELASSVSELTFSGIDLFNFESLFYSLMPKLDQLPTVPRLAKISLDIHSRFITSQFPSQLFVRMIYSRQSTLPGRLPVRLRHVALHAPPNKVDPAALKELNGMLSPLQEAGLLLTWDFDGKTFECPSAWY